MKATLRSVANSLLALGNAFPTPATSTSDLQNLIKRLQPVHPGRDLIRVGPDGDGGYLVPDDLEGVEACFSPGVSDVSGFELECANRGMRVFLADWSVDGPASAHPAFSFEKKYVGAVSGDQFMTMDEWVHGAGVSAEGDCVLQMDIEGYEYETILSMSESLMRQFRIIIIEFHDLDDLFSKPFFSVAARAFEKILRHHTCVHIHPNNVVGSVRLRGIEIPSLMEFTFLRSDRVQHATPARTFPHPLDRSNTDNPPLELPACWYHSS